MCKQDCSTADNECERFDRVHPVCDADHPSVSFWFVARPIDRYHLFMFHHNTLAVGFSILWIFVIAGCRAAEFEEQNIERKRVENPWSASFTPPHELNTPMLHLEPLGPEHTPLDFAAFMSCREFISESLHWGNWPRPDMTLELNQRDLEGHAKNFRDRTQFTYTVMTPARDRVVGCIYMNPVRRKNPSPRHMELDWWVSESELRRNLDQHLLASVLSWVRAEFPFDRVEIPNYKDYARGHALLRSLGLPVERRSEGGRDYYLDALISA